MKKSFILLFLFPFGLLFAQTDTDLFVQWSFDEINPSYKSVGKGHAVPGVIGKAYKFDGFSSYLEDRSLTNKEIPRSFSIEAWVSLGAYPWNWAPIVTIGKYKVTGFYFGIDSFGGKIFADMLDGEVCRYQNHSKVAAN